MRDHSEKLPAPSPLYSPYCTLTFTITLTLALLLALLQGPVTSFFTEAGSVIQAKRAFAAGEEFVMGYGACRYRGLLCGWIH